MADFILIKGQAYHGGEKTVAHYFNLDQITDFRYVPEKKFTQIGIAGEDEYRVFVGDVTKQILKQMPIRRQITGHWIGTEYDGYADGNPVYDRWECSECGYEVEGDSDALTFYCPYCGKEGSNLDQGRVRGFRDGRDRRSRQKRLFLRYHHGRLHLEH